MRFGGLNRANILILDVLLFTNVAVTSAQQITGRVMDAVTGAPLVGSAIRLPAAQRFVLTNRDGIFRLPSLVNGKHEISVDHIGYASVLLQVEATDSAQHLEIKLEPQPVVLERITVVHDRLEERRKRAGNYSRVFTREEILAATTSNPVSFLEKEGGLKTTICPQSYADAGAICVMGGMSSMSSASRSAARRRGGMSQNIALRVVPVIVYIDDRLVGSLQTSNGGYILEQYALQDLYRIETYEFSGRVVRAYTLGYMHRMTGARSFVDDVIWQHADAIADQERARTIRQEPQ